MNMFDRHFRNLLVVAAMGAGLLLAASTPGSAGTQKSAPLETARERAAGLLADLPLAFDENRGLAAEPVRFLSRGPGYAVFLAPDEAILALPHRGSASAQAGPRLSSLLRMRLQGADAQAKVSGEGRLSGRSHYLVGPDSSAWKRNITQWGRVRAEEVYPGIDMVYYGSGRRLEYDFVVAPGADPNRIRLQFDGVEAVRREEETGDLLVAVPRAGDLRLHAPVIYQMRGEAREPVAGSYRVNGRVVSFELGRYDRSRELVIDPVLAYSSLVGGSNDDYGMGIAVDAESNAYVTGYTASYFRAQDNGPAAIEATPGYPVIPQLLGFPTQNPVQSDPDPVVFGLDLDVDSTTAPTPFVMSYYDAFVFKIDPTGRRLIYSTYLGGRDHPGGTGDDYGTAIAVNPAGEAYVTGMTYSLSFPTERPIQASNGFNGGDYRDAFISKLNAGGSSLLYSTYFGGSGYDAGRGIAVDANGNCVVTGLTNSSNLPVFRAFQPAAGGGRDQFVVNINALGSAYNYSTYLGGSGDEGGAGPDNGLNPYITHVPSATIIATGAVFPGARLDIGSRRFGPDYGAAVAVDEQGYAYITGATNSADFPVVGPVVQPAIGGGQDAFVTRIDPFGQILTGTAGFSTFLGGSGNDGGRGIAVDASRRIVVAGYTTSTNFPTLNALQAANGGATDAFVARLSTAGADLSFSSYLGGSGDDVAYDVATDFASNIFVAGSTRSGNFPTRFALQSSLRPGFITQDAFLTKIKADLTEYEYSTFLGGAQPDLAAAVAVNNIGTAFIAGSTVEYFDAGFTGVSTFPTTFFAFQRFMRFPTENGLASPAYGRDPVTGLNSYPLAEVFVSRIANPPQAPSDLVVTNVTQTEIALAWQDNSNNETGFQIERKRAGGEFELVATVEANRVTFVDTGLIPAASYTYRVRAANLEGTSAYTNQVSTTTLPEAPAAPSNLVVTTVDRERLRLDWSDNSNNESEFRIERRTGSQGFREIAVVPANSTSFTDTGLSPNTTYTYRVLARNLGGVSVYSNEASGSTLPDPPGLAPTGLTATAVSSRQIDLAWQDANTNETGFKVERKIAGGQFEVVRILIGADITSFSDTGLQPETTYVYRVRAFNVTSDGPPSNEATAATPPDPPAAPSNLRAVTVAAGRIDLTWRDNSGDEDAFHIERSTDASNFTEIGTTGANVTSFSDTRVEQNQTYFYRVRARRGPSFSEYSNIAAQDGRPTPPTDLRAEAASSTSIALSWVDNSSNETGFLIERGTDGASFVQVASVGADVVSYTDRGLTPGTRYFYRVRSSSPQGNSPYSNIASASTLPAAPAAPSNLRGEFVSGTQVRLLWQDNSDNEESFILERSTDGAEFVQITVLEANTTEYVDGGRDPGSIYFYRVKARSAGGDSPYSNTIQVTFPPTAPVNLTAQAINNSQVMLNWTDTSANESGFQIERRTGDGPYVRIAQVGPNIVSYLDGRLSGGETYTYRVRAFNSGGASEWSNEASAATLVRLLSLKVPKRIARNSSGKGTVTLEGPAPAGGAVISLSSFKPELAAVPASVTIPAGQTSAEFTIRTGSRRGKATIIASYGGQSRQGQVRVR